MIHHSAAGVFILCNIWYLLIYSYKEGGGEHMSSLLEELIQHLLKEGKKSYLDIVTEFGISIEEVEKIANVADRGSDTEKEDEV